MSLHSQDRALLREGATILAIALLVLAVPVLLWLAAYSLWMTSYDTVGATYWAWCFYTLLGFAGIAMIGTIWLFLRSARSKLADLKDM